MQKLGALWLLLGLLAVPFLGRPGPARTRIPLDFREVVKKGKDRVFPAVVFIKVVRQDMQRGEKTSQEVSGSGVLISA
jgi:hypothetical protein